MSIRPSVLIHHSAFIVHHFLFHLLAREHVLRREEEAGRDEQHDEYRQGREATVKLKCDACARGDGRSVYDPVEEVAAEVVEHAYERDSARDDRYPPLLEPDREEERRRVDHQRYHGRPHSAPRTVR